jgi:hypothetical protein
MEGKKSYWPSEETAFLANQRGRVQGVMKQRIKVLQLHPDYNIKRHDFADLGEQILNALPRERFETVTGFLHGRPLADEPQ